MKLSMGEVENWDSDGHNFLAKAASKWNATDHNGMSISQYLLRADPIAILEKRAMPDTDFAKLDAADVLAADRLAYDLLNSMFIEGSTAKTVLTMNAKSGAIEVEEGLKAFTELHKEFGVTDSTLDVAGQVEALMEIKMQQGEPAGKYLLRFFRIVNNLKLKDPPQVLPEGVLITWLVSGLTNAYGEVKKRQKRGEYSVDIGKICVAVRNESRILGAASGDAEAMVVKAEKKKNKQAKAEKKRGKAAAAEALAASNEGVATDGSGTGKGKQGKGKKGMNPDANKQCYQCWNCGHVSANCPTGYNANAAAAQGGNEGLYLQEQTWCPFHHARMRHTPEQCYRNPNYVQPASKG